MKRYIARTVRSHIRRKVESPSCKPSTNIWRRVQNAEKWLTTRRLERHRNRPGAAGREIR